MDTLHVLNVLFRFPSMKFIHTIWRTRKYVCCFDYSRHAFDCGVEVKVKGVELSTCLGRTELNVLLDIGVNTENACRGIEKRWRKSMADGALGSRKIFLNIFNTMLLNLLMLVICNVLSCVASHFFLDSINVVELAGVAFNHQLVNAMLRRRPTAANIALDHELSIDHATFKTVLQTHPISVSNSAPKWITITLAFKALTQMSDGCPNMDNRHTMNANSTAESRNQTITSCWMIR